MESAGPDGMHASVGLADNLRALGLPLRRFKTGTPPRVNRRSIDFSKMELQPGDETPEPFSFRTTHKLNNQAVCYLTYTNEETHKVIKENLHRSPMYDGTISGVGPRYCPSIETKIVRFADKNRHQLFIEPCGLDTEEMYIHPMVFPVCIYLFHQLLLVMMGSFGNLLLHLLFHIRIGFDVSAIYKHYFR